MSDYYTGQQGTPLNQTYQYKPQLGVGLTNSYAGSYLQQPTFQSSSLTNGNAGEGSVAGGAIAGIGAAAAIGQDIYQDVNELNGLRDDDPNQYVWQSGAYREGQAVRPYYETDNPYADAAEWKGGEVATDLLSDTAKYTGIGASVGTAIAPGIGTAIGAGVGAVAGLGKGLVTGLSKRKRGREQSARFKEAQQRARDTYSYQKRVFEEERQKMKQKGAEQASMRNRMMGGMDSPASDLYGY